MAPIAPRALDLGHASAREAMTSPRLLSDPLPEALRIRIVAGILYAAARFVPVPILDDLVREQIARWLVRSSLPAGTPREPTRPLYADASGCLGGLLRALFMIPIKLVLFPVRKVLAIVLGVRWVARDLAEMILLGRVIDHAIAEKLLSPSAAPEAIGAQAHDLRKAFDVALRGTDTKLLVALLGASIGPVRALVSPALRAIRALRLSGGESPSAEQPELDPAIGRIQRALETPEVRSFLAEFDRRVLENLAVLRERR